MEQLHFAIEINAPREKVWSVLWDDANEFLSFKHMTEIKDGKEQPPPHWSGMIENYTLKEDGGATTLVVDMDAPNEFKAMFEDKFPKALARVKELAEGK